MDFRTPFASLDAAYGGLGDTVVVGEFRLGEVAVSDALNIAATQFGGMVPSIEWETVLARTILVVVAAVPKEEMIRVDARSFIAVMQDRSPVRNLSLVNGVGGSMSPDVLTFMPDHPISLLIAGAIELPTGSGHRSWSNRDLGLQPIVNGNLFSWGRELTDGPFFPSLLVVGVAKPSRDGWPIAKTTGSHDNSPCRVFPYSATSPIKSRESFHGPV